METPAVAHAELGPGNGHPLPARRAAFGREVDDSIVVLHVLELVLLGGLHVHHRVLVHVLLQDHRLQRKTMEDLSLDGHGEIVSYCLMIFYTRFLFCCGE